MNQGLCGALVGRGGGGGGISTVWKGARGSFQNKMVLNTSIKKLRNVYEHCPDLHYTIDFCALDAYPTQPSDENRLLRNI